MQTVSRDIGIEAKPCIFLQIYTPEVVVVEQLADSVRGAGGFGSTGTN